MSAWTSLADALYGILRWLWITKETNVTRPTRGVQNVCRSVNAVSPARAMEVRRREIDKGAVPIGALLLEHLGIFRFRTRKWWEVGYNYLNTNVQILHVQCTIITYHYTNCCLSSIPITHIFLLQLPSVCSGAHVPRLHLIPHVQKTVQCCCCEFSSTQWFQL